MGADSDAMVSPTSAPLASPSEIDTVSAPHDVHVEKSCDEEAGDTATPANSEPSSPSPTAADAALEAAEGAAPPTVTMDEQEDQEGSADEMDDEVEEAESDEKDGDADTDEEEKLDTTIPSSTKSVALDASVPPTPPTELPPLAPPSGPTASSATARAAASARGEGPDSTKSGRASASMAARPQSTSAMAVQRAESGRGIVGGPAANRAWNMQHYIRTNARVNRLVQAALLKTLIHAIRRGSVEGVRVAIERGVIVQYYDSRQRNLIMLATKCDTDARLPIVVILADAGCDIDHADQLGWNCLHYACASGAMDVAAELVRRGARIEYNPYGYGPEEFVIPKVAKAKSLLQHTEQLQHEKNVKACWDYFTRQSELGGYAVKCRSHCDLGKPLRVAFLAPAGHSSLDRIRVVDMNSEVALWLQVSKTFPIPPGDIGSITLDSETLDRPSLYRIFYEKYEPAPLRVPAGVAEKAFSIKNLDNGTTVSMGSVNKLVLKELETTRGGRTTKHTSNSSREAPDSRTKSVRRMSTRSGHAESEHEPTESEADETEPELVPNDTITVATIEEHPAVNSITGVYRVVAMAIVSVSTFNSAKPNEYEVTIRNEGVIGLHMEAKTNTSKRTTKLIVRRSSGQAASVNPGDCLVAIGTANIEHAGLKHTLWELNEAPRPMVLRFRRGTQKEKRSLFTGLRKLSGGKAAVAIAV